MLLPGQKASYMATVTRPDKVSLMYGNNRETLFLAENLWLYSETVWK